MGALLSELLRASQELGFVGPGPLDDHVRHALGFAALLPVGDLHALDLGAGGGLPGLVLAATSDTSRWTLLDANERRTAFLAHAVASLGIADRVEVVRGRAEDVARQPERRGRYDAVTARSFAPPAATAECAAPFLRVGGRLVVSEPPGSVGTRWSHPALADLGLRFHDVAHRAATYVSLEQVTLCPPSFPRAVGTPAKRPLFPDVSRGTDGRR